MKTEIFKRAQELQASSIEMRRHLHRNPELSYQEHQTTEYIISQLSELGLEIHRPLETGCVAVLKGMSAKRVIALRADIDALPIQEEGTAKQNFLSQKPGIAHCCGHDAHTAGLLTAARIVAEQKSELEGSIVFIFQPGEEKLPGGGKLLSRTGILDQFGVQKIFGLHTSPDVAVGKIGVKDGNFMARPDEFEITVKGMGGHAAKPHLSVDPIVISSQIIMAIQSIISRNVNPLQPAVITIGHINAGHTYNVIPEKAFMKGTIRSFDKTLSRQLAARIRETAEGIASSAGGSAEVQINEGYPAVINPPELNDIVRKTAKDIFGTDVLFELQEPVMAGEDFAFYQENYPGAFFFLGTGSNEADSRHAWHHPRYNIDEKALAYGAAIMAGLAFTA